MPEPRWYKGNIHTHTTESDGDAEPERVVRWYRRHGYDFLVLSDHNHLTLLDYGSQRRRSTGPLMIPGEEVSASILEGTVPVHIGGIGISRVIEPIDTSEIVSTIQANVDAILAAGGIAAINHPNAGWAIDHEHLKKVDGASLLEIYNGWPGTNGAGAPGKFSNEQIWDGVLSSGKPIFGVATDDAHHYRDFTHLRANPGRGWVMVRAAELTADAIVDGLAAGGFYASTGVTLADLKMSEDAVRIEIEQQAESVYTTSFQGRDGAVLAEITGPQATYRPTGDEGYVRATVRASSGVKAWTQPVFVANS